MASEIYKRTNPNKWLGVPLTGPGVVPASAGLIPPSGKSILLSSAQLQNRTASTAATLLVGLLRDDAWTAGQWADATTTFTDDTVDAQDVGTNDFALEGTGAADDGHLVSAAVPFGIISYDISTDSVGSPVRVANYWNGSAWTALTAAQLISFAWATTNPGLGESILAFEPPVDWAVGGSGTGVPAGKYNLLVKSTTSPSTAGLAKRLYVGVVLGSNDGVAANDSYDPPMGLYGVLVPSYLAGVGAAFSVADAGNNLHLVYRFLG